MKCFITLILLSASLAIQAAQSDDPIGIAVENYFTSVFAKLGEAAGRQPTHDTFRTVMKPAAESIDGFFGGSLITPDFVIDQSYYRFHAPANGYDLKKVKELDYFRERMRTAPAPQLSEPGRGSILQPRLISMRYPVIAGGRLQSIVSIMVRTERFLEVTGLNKCRAYKIICRGVPAEEKGNLSAGCREVKLDLPSTEWVIQYDLK